MPQAIQNIIRGDVQMTESQQMYTDDATPAGIPATISAAEAFMGQPVVSDLPTQSQAFTYLQGHFDSIIANLLPAQAVFVTPDRLIHGADPDWLMGLLHTPYQNYLMPVPHYFTGQGMDPQGPGAWGLVSVDAYDDDVPLVTYYAPTSDTAMSEALWDHASNLAQPLLDAIANSRRHISEMSFDYTQVLAPTELTGVASLFMVRDAMGISLDVAPDIVDAGAIAANPAQPAPDLSMGPQVPLSLGPSEWLEDRHFDRALTLLEAYYPDLASRALLVRPSMVQVMRSGDYAAFVSVVTGGHDTILLPVNDRPLDSGADEGEGQHWSLLCLKRTQDPDSMIPVFDGYHYNSIPDGPLAALHASVAVDVTREANMGMPIQPSFCPATAQINGYQCGDHVITMMERALLQLREEEASGVPYDTMQTGQVQIPDRADLQRNFDPPPQDDQNLGGESQNGPYDADDAQVVMTDAAPDVVDGVDASVSPGVDGAMDWDTSPVASPAATVPPVPEPAAGMPPTPEPQQAADAAASTQAIPMAGGNGWSSVDCYGYPCITADQTKLFKAEVERALGDTKKYYENIVAREKDANKSGHERIAYETMLREVSDILEKAGYPVQPFTIMRVSPTFINEIMGSKRQLVRHPYKVNNGYVPQHLEGLAKIYCERVARRQAKPFETNASTAPSREQVREAYMAPKLVNNDVVSEIIEEIGNGKIPEYSLDAIAYPPLFRKGSKALAATDLGSVLPCASQTLTDAFKRYRPLVDTDESLKIKSKIPRYPDEESAAYIQRVFDNITEIDFPRHSAVYRLDFKTLHALFPEVKPSTIRTVRAYRGKVARDPVLNIMKAETGPAFNGFIKSLDEVKNGTAKTQTEIYAAACAHINRLSSAERKKLGISATDVRSILSANNI